MRLAPWRVSQVVRQRSAKPPPRVRIPHSPPVFEYTDFGLVPGQTRGVEGEWREHGVHGPPALEGQQADAGLDRHLDRRGSNRPRLFADTGLSAAAVPHEFGLGRQPLWSAI